jgi:thiosulfate/3-mercaptopyruvate sulfurtransferase
MQAHIPGAVFVDWVYEITDPDDPRHAQIAKPERFAAVASRLGIGPDTLVVAYDDADGMFAARMWWSLNYYGHENVAVLDGGWDKWLTEGRPTTADIHRIKPTKFQPRVNPAIYRTGEQILDGLHAQKRLLIDVRTPGEFAGQAARAKRKGHIPGAINIPRATLFSADHMLLPPDELRNLLARHGLTPDNTPEIVTYCNSGVSSSYGMLALRVAGFRHVAVYDGSWKEWGNDDSKPIET